MTASEFRIVSLTEFGQAEQACPCMTEVPSPWPQALGACRSWISQHLGTLIEGVHLTDGAGEVIVHIYYAASENALIPYRVEENVAVVYCEWIQRRHQGKGDLRLLSNALIRHLDDGVTKGVLVLAGDDEQEMHATNLTRRGFQLLKQSDSTQLMYYPLKQESVEVQSRDLRIAERQGHPVEVIVFSGGYCPYDLTTTLSALQVAREFGDRVTLKEVEVTVDNLHAYGAISGVFINGRRTLPGGSSEEAIRQAIRDALE